jgi:serine/threonine-protein kinase
LVKTVQEPEDASLTREGVVTGTPLYMPPEALVDPEKVDGRSDIYALGAVAYYLLTGTHVFDGKTVVEVCGHHVHTAPTPPSERLGAPVPEGLEAIVLKCLEKEADKRPADARELRDMLQASSEIGKWSRDDAAAWWEMHGEALRRKSRASSIVAGSRTLAVDLARNRTV